MPHPVAVVTTKMALEPFAKMDVVREVRRVQTNDVLVPCVVLVLKNSLIQTAQNIVYHGLVLIRTVPIASVVVTNPSTLPAVVVAIVLVVRVAETTHAIAK